MRNSFYMYIGYFLRCPFRRNCDPAIWAQRGLVAYLVGLHPFLHRERNVELPGQSSPDISGAFFLRVEAMSSKGLSFSRLNIYRFFSILVGKTQRPVRLQIQAPGYFQRLVRLQIQAPG